MCGIKKIGSAALILMLWILCVILILYLSTVNPESDNVIEVQY